MITNKKIGIIFWILALGVIIRLFLSFLPAFESDQNAFRFWTDRLAEVGPAHFYSSSVFTNNPLGILYFFWLVGLLKSTILSSIIFPSNIDLFLKLAGNAADLATGFLIYKIIKEGLNVRAGNIAALMYIFNPGLTFNSAVWGQYDSVAILFLVLSIYYCLIKKNSIICSIFFSLAWIIKPQALELAPFLFFFFLRNLKPIQWLYSFLAFIITTVIVFLPFFPNNPLYGIYSVNIRSTNLFNCITCNAFNFWGIFGNWKPDTDLFLNIPILYLGFILLAIFLLIILVLKKTKGNILYFTISISMLSFFMLLTRMHERYIAYFFPFILLSAILLKSRILIGFYAFFSLVFLLNLYLPYAYYNNLAKITNLPVNILMNYFGYFSFISFLGFILLFIYYLGYVKKNSVS